MSLDEHVQANKDGVPSPPWKKMPATMIRRVALVQAHRMALPEQLGGMYDLSEIPVEGSLSDEATTTIAEMLMQDESILDEYE